MERLERLIGQQVLINDGDFWWQGRLIEVAG